MSVAPLPNNLAAYGIVDVEALSIFRNHAELVDPQLGGPIFLVAYLLQYLLLALLLTSVEVVERKAHLLRLLVRIRGGSF